MKFVRLVFVTGGLCVAPLIGHSQTEGAGEPKNFLVLDKTKSPDGRYAVAWGLPQHRNVLEKGIQFEKQHHPATEELSDEVSKEAEGISQSVHDVSEDVENYIVDLRADKIVTKLDCPRTPGVDRQSEPEYWIVAGLKPNRHDLEVVWARAGNLVLVNHTWRWDCVTFCAVPLRDGNAGPIIDLNKKLENAVRIYVAKSFPRHFQYSKKDLNICFSELKQVTDTKFSAHVEAVVERYWSSDGATVRFTLTSSGENKFTLSAISIGRAESHSEN
jgi:hypothetical protein